MSKPEYSCNFMKIPACSWLCIKGSNFQPLGKRLRRKVFIEEATWSSLPGSEKKLNFCCLPKKGKNTNLVGVEEGIFVPTQAPVPWPNFPSQNFLLRSAFILNVAWVKFWGRRVIRSSFRIKWGKWSFYCVLLYMKNEPIHARTHTASSDFHLTFLPVLPGKFNEQVLRRKMAAP